MGKVKNVLVSLSGATVLVLTVLFTILKVTDYIDWSWLWVFSPIWIPVAILAGVFSLGLIFVWVSAVVVLTR